MTKKILIVRLVISLLLGASANCLGSVNFIVPSTDIPDAGEVVVGVGKGINLFETEIGMLDVGAIGLSMYGGTFKIRLNQEDEKVWWNPTILLVYSSLKDISIDSPTGSFIDVENLSTFNLSASKKINDSVVSVGVLMGGCKFTTSKDAGVKKEGTAIDPFISIVIPAPSGTGKMFLEAITCIQGFDEKHFDSSWYEAEDRYNGLVMFPPFLQGVSTGMVGLSQEFNLGDKWKFELGGGVAFSIGKDTLEQNTLVLSTKFKFKVQ